MGHRTRVTGCVGPCLAMAQKGGVGIYSMIPMDFWQKRLGYLRRMGQMGQIIPIVIYWLDLAPLPTCHFISYMR